MASECFLLFFLEEQGWIHGIRCVLARTGSSFSQKRHFCMVSTRVWPTDRPMDGRMDGRTDIPSYRDARTHVKSVRLVSESGTRKYVRTRGLVHLSSHRDYQTHTHTPKRAIMRSSPKEWHPKDIDYVGLRIRFPLTNRQLLVDTKDSFFLSWY